MAIQCVIAVRNNFKDTDQKDYFSLWESKAIRPYHETKGKKVAVTNRVISAVLQSWNSIGILKVPFQWYNVSTFEVIIVFEY